MEELADSELFSTDGIPIPNEDGNCFRGIG